MSYILILMGGASNLSMISSYSYIALTEMHKNIIGCRASAHAYVDVASKCKNDNFGGLTTET